MLHRLLPSSPRGSSAVQTAPYLSHPPACQVGIVSLDSFQSIGTKEFETVVYDELYRWELDIWVTPRIHKEIHRV